MFLNFYRKRALGLDISDYSIEIISLGGSIDNPKLLAMGRTVLEPGIVENSKILNKEKLITPLLKLIKNPKFGKIKTNKFIFSIPESKSFIHIFEIPENLEKKKILDFIKSQASQTFPFPLENLYLDFQIRDKEVLLVAAPKNIVQDYLDVFKKCRVSPLALEPESESLGRSLIEDKKETILILDIGARTTIFSIFDEKGLRLSISNEIAGNRFTKKISEKLNISWEKAESLKKKAGLKPGIKGGRVFLILQKEIQTGIIEEIGKIEKYFQEKEQKSIKKIILAGGSAVLPRLSEYLAENLEKLVSIGDPWAKINIDILKKKEYFKEALEVNPVFYSTVIGSSLRGLAKNPSKAGINLIKKFSTP